MVRINNECYVSLEVAKLLKKEGFDWKCNGVFLSEDGTQYTFIKMDAAWDSNNSKYNQYNISAPTLDVVQRWLREVKGYSIYPTRGGYKIYVLDINDSAGFSRTYELNSNLTYEESQESGIKKALELILKKGE